MAPNELSRDELRRRLIASIVELSEYLNDAELSSVADYLLAICAWR
jgi:hypothetical protein